MSKLVREGIEKYRKLISQASKEQTKIKNTFALYLLLAAKNMNDKEEIIFPNPQSPIGPYYSHNFTIRLRKNEVIEEKDGKETGRKSLLDYLSSIGHYWQITANRIEKAMKEIEKSSIDKKVTPEMVMKRYEEYKESRKEESRRERIFKTMLES